MAAGTDHRVEDIAHDLFGILTQLGLAGLRGQRRNGNLKEVEFLTLSLLQANGQMIVGNIQKLLGVLPAQMSRIIRSLENRDRPLIECHINPSDKRKINVAITMDGEQALSDYEKKHVSRLAEQLRRLNDEEQDDLGRLVNKMNDLFGVPA